jgi:tetratricopeptide (TPR) repeat protein
MSKKYRALRDAEKYVVARRYSLAIREYQKILQGEPEEPAILNTVGDLLLKEARVDEAFHHFKQVAELYLRSGFLLKAIAVYKKIHLIRPADEKINETLAELYQKQGLVYDAARHLSILIRAAEERGEDNDAIAHLKRLVILTPDDPGPHVRLAELQLRGGQTGAAVGAYRQAIKLSRSRGRSADVYDFAVRALTLHPADPDLLETLVEAAGPAGRLDAAELLIKEQAGHNGGEPACQIGLARILEKKGDQEGAFLIFRSLEADFGLDPRVREGLRRTAPVVPSTEEPHPFGVEEGFVPELSPEPAADLFHIEESADYTPGPELDFLSLSEERAADALFAAPADTPAVEPEEPVEEEQVEEAPPVVEEVPIDSLEEALQEADFYLKLGFKEEAAKLLSRLMQHYPSDDRVRRRAERVMTLPPREAAAAEPAVEAAPELEKPDPGDVIASAFEIEIDSALDSLFTTSGEQAPDEILRYDVSAGDDGDERNSPKVHYALGLAYKEMGLIDDAVNEFQSAFRLLDADPACNPQKILCCSMLANSFIQLERFDEAVEWAEEGLKIPGQKDFEWKALNYDLSCALQKTGETSRALEGYQQILDRDPDYRDVRGLIEELTLSGA